MTQPIQPTDEWIITGNEVICWLNDLECFDITFSPASETFALRLNHLGTATTVYLGESGSVAEAIGRARAHVAGHEQLELTCPHGLSVTEVCPACAAL